MYSSAASNQQGPGYKLTKLSSSSPTYAAVKDLVLETVDDDHIGLGADAKDLDYDRLVVTSISKLSNDNLSQAYLQYRNGILEQKRRDPNSFKSVPNLPHGGEQIMTIEKAYGILRDSCDESLNECYLLHGTSRESAKEILRTGFKREFCSKKSLFGQAIYLAESSSKADQYSDNEDNRVPNGQPLCMIVAKACLGRIHICHCKPQYFQRPPCTSACYPATANCEHPRCHSVVGTHKQAEAGRKPRGLLFREFVLYDNSACFPEFLVEYKRE